jgi:hypothetical protein
MGIPALGHRTNEFAADWQDHLSYSEADPLPAMRAAATTQSNRNMKKTCSASV